jgi:chromosome segregation ATPase
MSDTNKADQADVVANYESLATRLQALEGSLKAEQTARQNLEAQLKESNAKLAEAASKLTALEAKEADAAKRAAAAVATAGIVANQTPAPQKSESAPVLKNWTRAAAAKLGVSLA